MKKNYIAPQIETTFYEPILMESATKVTGSIINQDNGSEGEIGWKGTGSSTDNPDAKDNSNLWDGWDD